MTRALEFDPDEPVTALARRLLGAELWVRRRGLDPVAGRIVETEAYGPDDPASHAHRGPSPRNRAMFAAPGALYVYRSYGIHWCVNVAAEAEGVGAAVLIRAVEPIAGVDLQWTRRPKARSVVDLGSGPGKLCAALGIDGDDDGLLPDTGPIALVDGEAASGGEVWCGPRVGISKAVDRRWRFALGGADGRVERWVSGPRRTLRRELE
ncbi:MAG: DNA-3-methyladenine glycosylase [Acidimicrobiales bacterium]